MLVLVLVLLLALQLLLLLALVLSLLLVFAVAFTIIFIMLNVTISFTTRPFAVTRINVITNSIAFAVLVSLLVFLLSPKQQGLGFSPGKRERVGLDGWHADRSEVIATRIRARGATLAAGLVARGSELGAGSRMGGTRIGAGTRRGAPAGLLGVCGTGWSGTRYVGLARDWMGSRGWDCRPDEWHTDLSWRFGARGSELGAAWVAREWGSQD